MKDPILPNKEILKDIVQQRMPFGKYKGLLIADIPIHYLEWFHREKGFPPGKLGVLMATTLEIKANGLQHIIVSLKGMFSDEKRKS